MLNDKNLVRGLVLLGISLAFGLTATRYSFGSLGRAGPGLFPIIVSVMLGLIAVATIVRSRFVPKDPLDFGIKNITIILASLCGFAFISEKLNMVAGIIFMVFLAAVAGSTYSVSRNVKVSAALIAIAYGFHKLLGLNLHLL